jgi:hypothetical protein
VNNLFKVSVTHRTYELPSLTHAACGAGKNRRNTTIEMLPEDTLLEIFDFYRLDAIKRSRGRPWKWHRLAHVCRKWRYVVMVSPRRLGLQILCKSGAPIESILDSWSTLPLVVRYKGPKSKSLPKNIMVALRRPDRVCEVDLVLSSSLIGSIVPEIQEPFPALECIRITVKNAARPPELFSGPFLGGSAPRLKEIKLDGVAFPFPTIRQVLSSTANNLVQLCLSNIPNVGYFSPDALASSLSSLVQLMQLNIDFHSPCSRPPSKTCPPPQRVILPSLSILNFHGANDYLEEFVSQVDFPALTFINIEFFSQLIFQIPQFCHFISRVNALKSPTEVMMTPSAELVTLFFIQQGERRVVLGECFLGTTCEELDWQLSFVTQVLRQFSTLLLSSVDSLTINKPLKMPRGEGQVEPMQWLELFQPFTHVRTVHVFEQLVPDIVDALVAENTVAGVLPELSRLYLKGYRDSPSVAKAAEQFVAARRHSGRTVSLFN